jgi:hypothetical protein
VQPLSVGQQEPVIHLLSVGQQEPVTHLSPVGQQEPVTQSVPVGQQEPVGQSIPVGQHVPVGLSPQVMQLCPVGILHEVGYMCPVGALHVVGFIIPISFPGSSHVAHALLISAKNNNIPRAKTTLLFMIPPLWFDFCNRLILCKKRVKWLKCIVGDNNLLRDIRSNLHNIAIC